MNRLTVLSWTILLAACGPPDKPASEATGVEAAAAPDGVPEVLSRATPVTDLDLNACLSIARGDTASAAVQCPAFIAKGLGESIVGCKEAGGTVVAAAKPTVYSLDVNRDGRAEFLYDLTANFSCEGAPLYFSCGSEACEVGIFEQRADQWTAIGALRDGEGIEVVASTGAAAYATIREGCRAARPCDEVRFSTWDGSAYQLTAIEARGHWVDFANDGLWRLSEDADVLAAPAPGAAAIDRYAQGTDVVVLGTARDSSFKYVSPCNACASGFVDPAVMRKD
jgi:hypothetical protein